MATTSGFDPVPLSVNGGRHRGALLRVGLYASTKSEGIVSLDDCKVHELSVPGPQVMMDPGALLIRNRSNPEVSDQTYAASAPGASYIDITPTGSSPRSDLVVVRIEDPEFDPWSLPPGADPLTYDYAKPFVIENVPASTTSFAQYLPNLPEPYSAYACARVDMPANTATVLDDYITDLRRVANPRREPERRVFLPGAITERNKAYSASRFQMPQTNELIYCPEWASRMLITVSISGLSMKGTNVWANIRAEYGFASGSPTPIVTEPTGIHFESTPTDAQRQALIIGGDLYVPPGFRGKNHYLRTQALWSTSATSDASLREDTWTTVVTDVLFEERAA